MRTRLWFSILVLVGCAKQDGPPAADTTAAVAPAPPAPISLADLAGKWTVRTMPDGRDTTITSELVATATTEGWTMTIAGNPPQPARVRADGDSLMVEVGPFNSVLRKGTKVTTSSVYRLQDGQLVGSMVARYSGPNVGADSVLRGRQEATRAP